MGMQSEDVVFTLTQRRRQFSYLMNCFLLLIHLYSIKHLLRISVAFEKYSLARALTIETCWIWYTSPAATYYF